MCNPMLVVSAATAGQAISGAMGQQQAAKANSKYQSDLAIARNEQIAENNRLAGLSYREQVSSVGRKTVEDERAMAAGMRQSSLRSMEAQSTAKVAAGEAGAEGNSLDALLNDFKRTEGTYAAMTESNRTGARIAAEETKKALKMQAEGRVASIQPYTPAPVTQPDYLGAALRIGSGIWSAGEKYQGWGK